MIWSIVPPEELLVKAASNQYREISYKGHKIIVENIDSEHCRIVQLVSTNPFDYLNDEIVPGQVLNYHN